MNTGVLELEDGPGRDLFLKLGYLFQALKVEKVDLQQPARDKPAANQDERDEKVAPNQAAGPASAKNLARGISRKPPYRFHRLRLSSMSPPIIGFSRFRLNNSLLNHLVSLQKK